MNKLQIFNNAEFGSVRRVEQDGKILFCGKDATYQKKIGNKPYLKREQNGIKQCRKGGNRYGNYN